jgi:hypothetical protein
VEVLLLLLEHDTEVRKRFDDLMTFTLGMLAADLSSSIIYGETYHTVTRVRGCACLGRQFTSSRAQFIQVSASVFAMSAGGLILSGL